MKIVNGGVTAAQGFTAHGMSCGIKRSGKPDLALIYSQTPCVSVGVFTKNSVKAAPLVVTMGHLKNSKAQAVIVNSGNANCFTGNFGLIYAKLTCRMLAKALKINETDVIVSSTGIIGRPLPYEKIIGAIPALIDGLKTSGHRSAAQAILTTDLAVKELAVRCVIGGKTITIGGCAKGSGMIAPNMATMLGFLTTDAAISAPLLKIALKNATEVSFNSITIDGCMSTNDMVTVMANGAAKNKPVTTQGKDFKVFCEALTAVCLDLAKKIVIDGEGATKFIEITCKGAKTAKQAKTAAMTIANSPLVKTAAYGSNPNWGRVAAAVGSLGWNVTEKNLKITFSSFAKKNISMTVDIQQGPHQATVYTCDLSNEYVNINGRYN